MSEELQKALGELLSKANNGIDAASGFLVSELPDVIQQLLMWHGVRGFVLFIIGVIGLASIYKQSMYLISKVPEKPAEKGGVENWAYSIIRFNCGDSISSKAALDFFIIGSVVFIIVESAIYIAMLNLKWLQIWIAPKVWLLEYAAKLAS